MGKEKASDFLLYYAIYIMQSYNQDTVKSVYTVCHMNSLTLKNGWKCTYNLDEDKIIFNFHLFCTGMKVGFCTYGGSVYKM